MGCGKTLCAVEVAKRIGMIPFIVSPKAVIPAWEATLNGQGVKGEVVGWEKIRGGKTAFLERRGKAKFIWKLKKNHLLIFDEIHKAKGTKTLQSKLVLAAVKQKFKCLALSATPMEDPREMKALGALLGLHTGANFWEWAMFWGCKFDEWGALVFPDEAKDRLPELRQQIYPFRGSFMQRSDLGEHFSECRINYDPVDFGANSRLKTLLVEMSEEMERLDERRELDGDDPIPLTRLLRLRQEIELLKVPALADMITDSREQGLSVTVFLNFADSIDALSKRLKENHVFLRGNQSTNEREGAIQRFQSNLVRIIIAQSQAGGVGVSLHDKEGQCPRISFISPDYNAKNFKQVLGRTDRLGAKSESTIKVLVAADTIEGDIVSKLMNKIENIDLLRDDNDVESTTMKAMTTPDTEIHTDSEGDVHHEYGPSGLKNRQTCAGYSPTRGTNPAAEMGTRIHKALETGDWSKLSDWESHLTQKTHDAKTRVLRSAHRSGINYEKFDELLLKIPLLGGEEIFGTCDVVQQGSDHGILIDYKTGVHAVAEPEKNTQAIAYSIGCFEKFPQVNTVDFFFICCQREEILSGTFHRKDIGDMKELIGGIIKRSKHTLANWEDVKVEDLNPQSLNCDYCGNAGSCPALAQKMVDVVRYDGDIDTYDVLSPDKLATGADLYDPETISKLLDYIPILEKAIKGWKARSREMIFDDCVEIPGYEIKERSSPRKIKDVGAAWAALENEFGDQIDLADFLESVNSFPVLKYEKIISSLSERGDKKGNIAKVTKVLEEEGAIDHGGGVIQYINKIK